MSVTLYPNVRECSLLLHSVNFHERWSVIFSRKNALQRVVNVTNESCMCDAAKYNNTKLIRQFYGQNHRLLNQADASGCTPLIYAAYYEQVDAVNTLLDLGADANASSKRISFDKTLPAGATSLWIAAKSHNVCMAILLLRFDAIVPNLDKDGLCVIERAKDDLERQRFPLKSALQVLTQIPTEVKHLIVNYI
jgi:ankyrin repeat protein